MLEVIAFLEDTFGVVIDPTRHELTEFETVNGIAALVDQATSGLPAAEGRTLEELLDKVVRARVESRVERRRDATDARRDERHAERRVFGEHKGARLRARRMHGEIRGCRERERDACGRRACDDSPERSCGRLG